MVPTELNPENEKTKEEVEQQDHGELWNGPLPMFENKEMLVVNGAELRGPSALAVLREAAEFLGIGRGGSKHSLWTRLHQQVQKLENQSLFVTANRLFREENQHKGFKCQDSPQKKNDSFMNSHMCHFEHGAISVFHARAEMMRNVPWTSQRKEEELCQQSIWTMLLVGRGQMKETHRRIW